MLLWCLLDVENIWGPVQDWGVRCLRPMIRNVAKELVCVGMMADL